MSGGHYCHCGKWGSFGFKRQMVGADGITEDWYCRDHRPPIWPPPEPVPTELQPPAPPPEPKLL